MKNKPKEAKGFVHRPRAEYKTVILPDGVTYAKASNMNSSEAHKLLVRRIALIREANGLSVQEA